MADTGNPMALFVFILANVLITAGYVFLALGVLPRLSIQLLRTKIGGIGFFLLCGLTHLNMALMAVVQDEDHTYAHDCTTWVMLAIHVPQAICVWLFVIGVYIEIGDFGLLKTKDAARRERESEIDSLDAVHGDGPVDHL